MHHAAYGLAAHLIPFVGLRVESDVGLRIEIAEHALECKLVDVEKDVGDEQFEAERQHLAYGSETDGKRRAPTREMPTEQCRYSYKHNALGGNAPECHLA